MYERGGELKDKIVKDT